MNSFILSYSAAAAASQAAILTAINDENNDQTAGGGKKEEEEKDLEQKNKKVKLESENEIDASNCQLNSALVITILRQVDLKRKCLDHIIQVLNQTLNNITTKLSINNNNNNETNMPPPPPPPPPPSSSQVEDK